MTKMLIGGEESIAKAKGELEVIDPASEEIIESVPAGGPEDVDSAVQAAVGAFQSWASTDAEERASLMRKGLERVKENRDDIVQTLVHEQGKPLHEASGEFSHFIHGMEYYAELATKVRGAYQTLPSTLGTSYGQVIKRPVGVCAAIVPSNFPLTLLGTKIGPALAAGNTVVVKPAATTPLSALKVCSHLAEASIPPGVLNVVTGAGSVIGEALVGHRDVRRVAFTGGTENGRRVMEIAGPKFKRVSLELGGSDPVIVCSDADIKKAVKGALIARFWNAGQSCLAGKRLYVLDDIYDDYLQALLTELERYEPGEGWEKAEKPKIRIGPLHTEKGRDEVQAQLKDATDRGGGVIFGGGVPADHKHGYFLNPTVVEGAPTDSRLFTEEVFGPVLPVTRVKDLDEAIALANNSPFGLGSSIWTHDVRNIHRAAQEIDAGMTWVNQIHYGYDELPFGGMKQSGLGKEHGPEALDDYFEVKSVVIGGLD
jgi:acyl-CoA reductase-like NAD-dependent aldehyde dehydrogenase